jgi:hypothetical protein
MNTLIATAYDKAGNATASAPVSVNVANAGTTTGRDTAVPVVTIDNPTPGYVSGSVAVSMHATDNNGAAALTETLYIDNVQVATGKGGTLAYTWNTRNYSYGYHKVKAMSKDAAGNWASVTNTVYVVR